MRHAIEDRPSRWAGRIVVALLLALSLVTSACGSESNEPGSCDPGDPGYPDCTSDA